MLCKGQNEQLKTEINTKDENQSRYIGINIGISRCLSVFNILVKKMEEDRFGHVTPMQQRILGSGGHLLYIIIIDKFLTRILIYFRQDKLQLMMFNTPQNCPYSQD